MGKSWDENGNPVNDDVGAMEWDEHGNPITAEPQSTTPSAASVKRSRISLTGREAPPPSLAARGADYLEAMGTMAAPAAVAAFPFAPLATVVGGAGAYLADKYGNRVAKHYGADDDTARFLGHAAAIPGGMVGGGLSMVRPSPRLSAITGGAVDGLFKGSPIKGGRQAARLFDMGDPEPRPQWDQPEWTPPQMAGPSPRPELRPLPSGRMVGTPESAASKAAILDQAGESARSQAFKSGVERWTPFPGSVRGPLRALPDLPATEPTVAPAPVPTPTVSFTGRRVGGIQNQVAPVASPSTTVHPPPFRATGGTTPGTVMAGRSFSQPTVGPSSFNAAPRVTPGAIPELMRQQRLSAPPVEVAPPSSIVAPRGVTVPSARTSNGTEDYSGLLQDSIDAVKNGQYPKVRRR